MKKEEFIAKLDELIKEGQPYTEYDSIINTYDEPDFINWVSKTNSLLKLQKYAGYMEIFKKGINNRDVKFASTALIYLKNDISKGIFDILLRIYKLNKEGYKIEDENTQNIANVYRYTTWRLKVLTFLKKHFVENISFLREFDNKVEFCSMHYVKIGISILLSLGQSIRQGDCLPLQDKKAEEETRKESNKKQNEKRVIKNNDIFIVHGHDDAMKLEVEGLIREIGLNPIILHKKPNEGKTIIEKLEKYSDVNFAVILLSPDDVGCEKDKRTRNPRARQNVIFEFGYFVGKIGRPHVPAIIKGDIEIQSDIQGVIYIKMAGNWKIELANEIQNAGYNITKDNIT